MSFRRPSLQRSLALLAVLLLCVSAVPSGKTAEHSEESKSSLVPSLKDEGLQLVTRPGDPEPLLITTLDGRVAAVDRDSGHTLWTFDTENALVSAKGSAGYSFNVVPGVQGELYTQPRGGQAGFQMLPETLPEWVEKTPFVMSDGSLWLGSRHTHAFYVDPVTGRLIKSMVEYGDAGFQGNLDAIALPEGKRPILLGRVDYRVRAVHQDSGVELFNVSYSRLSLLDSSLKLPTFGDTHALDAGSEAGQLGISLDPERKNAILRVDPSTGEKLWSVAFDQPPITVFADGEIGMSLYGAPAWPEDSIAAKLGVGKKKQNVIMVESIAGNFYVLPMVTPQQKSELMQLMPPDAPEVVQQEGEQCSQEDTATPPSSSDEVMDVAAARSGEDINKSTWQDVLGVHYLDTTPSLFVTERIPTAVKDEQAKGKGVLFDMGLVTTSSVAGAVMVAYLAFAWLNHQPRVIASLKTQEEGVRKLTLSYTGTTKEAEAARKKGKELEEESPATQTSQIRDWTGSGREHVPDQEDSEGDETADVGKKSAETTSAASADERDRAADAQNSDGEQPTSSQGTSEETASQRGSSDGSSPSKIAARRKMKRKRKAAADLAAGVTPFEDKAREDFEAGSSSQSGDESSDTTRGKERAGDAELSEGFARANRPGTSSEDQATDNDSGSDPSSRQNPHLRRSEWRNGVTYVGRLAIGPGIVGYGSSGTLVFEGSLDGRQVAVKRVLRQFYELARKEIGALIVADEHPNIVRCFAMEEDTEFVYLALERCKQSLNDVLGSGSPQDGWSFVGPDGMPTALCMRVCEEVGRGLLALHERSIVHRDLKPHNVLFTEAMRTKLSDMGLCKRLTTDQTSYDSAGPGGSTGWQAPEQLILRSGGEARQGRSVDIFTFGLLLFYCLSGGQHPFGEGVERDYRILNGRADLGLLSRLPEAVNLIRAMLRPQPKQRPTVAAIMAHPFWWDPSKKLAFLVDLSNRLENEDREVDRSLLRSLEACAEEAIGGHSWAARLDPEFLANLGRYRKYTAGSLRDLLRVIRNKHNHFREMPEGLQERVGRTPEAFLAYFTQRFPELLLTAYSFALSHCSQEPLLQKYFPISAKDFPFASAAVAGRLAQKKELPQGPPTLKDSNDRTKSAPSAWKREPLLATVDELRESTQRAKSETNLLPPPQALPKTGRAPLPAGLSGHRGWWSSTDSDSASETGRAASTSSASSAHTPDPQARPAMAGHSLTTTSSTASGLSRNSLHLSTLGARDPQPRRPPFQGPALPPKGAPGGMMVTAASLPLRESAVNLLSAPADAEGSLTVDDSLAFARAAVEVPASLKVIHDREGHVTVFPQRPGGAAPDCDFFLKTGSCKFGAACHFHHPLASSVKMTSVGEHPIRPGQPVCPFYDRTGSCKFGPACKFHHPPTPACMSSQPGGTSQQQTGVNGMNTHSSAGTSTCSHPSS